MTDLTPRMRSVLGHGAFDLLVVNPSHRPTMESRLVQDLGVAGDDWDEIVPSLEAAYGIPITLPAGWIPGELSTDAFLVTLARGRVARRRPRLQAWLLRRIEAPPLTLGHLERIILGP